MYCPACGAKNSTQQRFCRSCGLNLEPAAQSLLEQFPAGERPDLARREQRLERFGQLAFGGFGIVVLIAAVGIIYTIFRRMVLAGDQPWAGALLIAFIIFAVLTLTYVVFAEDLKEKRKKAVFTEPRELEGPRTTGRLLDESRFEPVPTVTERTTDLLPSQKRDR